MLLPSRIAHIEQPLPRCATISRAFGVQASGHVFVGEPVKPVAPQALAFEGARQAEPRCDRRLGCVKRGIETGDLRKPGPVGCERADRRDIVRLVMRRERLEGGKAFDRRGIEPDRCGEFAAAMHNAMAAARERRCEPARFEPVDQRADRAVMAADIVERWLRNCRFDGAAGDAEGRRLANAGDLAARDIRKSAAGRIVEREF
jgi:hypothetical protein